MVDRAKILPSNMNNNHLNPILEISLSVTYYSWAQIGLTLGHGYYQINTGVYRWFVICPLFTEVNSMFDFCMITAVSCALLLTNSVLHINIFTGALLYPWKLKETQMLSSSNTFLNLAEFTVILPGHILLRSVPCKMFFCVKNY